MVRGLEEEEAETFCTAAYAVSRKGARKYACTGVVVLCDGNHEKYSRTASFTSEAHV